MSWEYLLLTTNGLSTELEHEVTLVLPGERESVRPRLVAALEQLGYRIVSEQPLMAKRRARSEMSANILDYAQSLILGLKPLGERATQVTFAYTVKNQYGLVATAGDRQTLQREAEAIVALARQAAQASTCPMCQAEVVPGSRFCRQCGALLTVYEPAELEVMRLTSKARAAHQTLVTGLIFLAVCSLCLLPVPWMTSAKLDKVLMLLTVLFGVPGWVTLLLGSWRLHRTLNPPREQTEQALNMRRSLIPSPATTSLPPSYEPMSLTEHTTELLESESNRQQEPPPRHRDIAS